MKSPLAYVGGKSKLADTLIGMIPEHRTYCEAFAGAGWVFFKKDPSRFEIINDLDHDLVSFYRVVQNHLEEFLRQFKWLLSSREWFDDWKTQIENQGLTDIQRAARYYYIQRQAFGGKVKGRTFGAGREHRPRINLLRLEEELSEVHLRLVRVTIESLTWSEFIRRYDAPETFFFCDPPYYKAPYYRHNMEMKDFQALADQLAGIRGKFILTINDVPEMRECFGRFEVEPVELKYSIRKETNTVGKELVVRNY